MSSSTIKPSRRAPRENGSPNTVLVVDDDKRNIVLIEAMLKGESLRIIGASSGQECLNIVKDVAPDIIILDIMMPGMTGIEVCKRLRETPETYDIPIIFVTGLDDKSARIEGKTVGGDDFLTKPIDMTELVVRTKNLLKLKAYHDEIKEHRDQLERKVLERTQEVIEAHEETLLRLSLAAEFKDDDTGSHLIRMSQYTGLIARELGFDDRAANLIRQAAVTHDIGKIGVPESILTKPGKLTDEEWVVMRTHTTIGARILGGSKSELLRLSEKIALSHHERWDGKGYPHGITADAIPIEARMVAVADVFDALTSKRPYKRAFEVNESVEIMKEGAGSQFDTRVVNGFLNVLPEVLVIKDKYHQDLSNTTSYVLNQLAAPLE